VPRCNKQDELIGQVNEQSLEIVQLRRVAVGEARGIFWNTEEG
jgi:hypothetical protein